MTVSDEINYRNGFPHMAQNHRLILLVVTVNFSIYGEITFKNPPFYYSGVCHCERSSNLQSKKVKIAKMNRKFENLATWGRWEYKHAQATPPTKWPRPYLLAIKWRYEPLNVELDERRKRMIRFYITEKWISSKRSLYGERPY